MGQLFMVNPPKRKSRKRRTAKQQAATRKMLAANRAKRRGTKKRRRSTAKVSPRRRRKVATVAKRRRRTTARKAAPRRRRRSSTAKRRSPITTLRRRSVYMTNPRRRRGRRRFRRNPALFSQLRQGAMDAGATLVGGAVGRFATGLLPLPKDGIAGVASSLAVALGVGIAARKVVSADTARFITAGAMQVPIKNLITTFVPQAGAFLGDYDSVGSYALPNGNGMGNYLSPGMYAYENEDVEIGVYE
jgi:hypothetical protein